MGCLVVLLLAEQKRGQWKINQPPSLRENERAWKECERAD